MAYSLGSLTDAITQKLGERPTEPDYAAITKMWSGTGIAPSATQQMVNDAKSRYQSALNQYETQARQITAEYGNKQSTLASAQQMADQQAAESAALKSTAATDRSKLLSELDAFKAGINEGYVTQNLQREQGLWNAKIASSVAAVQKNYSALGRVASPYLLGELKRRMVAQAADALQVRRVELENEVQNQKAKYLSMLSGVQAQSNAAAMGQVLDPATTVNLMTQVGANASSVKAV